jgi:hypothetical protein
VVAWSAALAIRAVTVMWVTAAPCTAAPPFPLMWYLTTVVLSPFFLYSICSLYGLLLVLTWWQIISLRIHPGRCPIFWHFVPRLCHFCRVWKSHHQSKVS